MIISIANNFTGASREKEREIMMCCTRTGIIMSFNRRWHDRPFDDGMFEYLRFVVGYPVMTCRRPIEWDHRRAGKWVRVQLCWIEIQLDRKNPTRAYSCKESSRRDNLPDLCPHLHSPLPPYSMTKLHYATWQLSLPLARGFRNATTFLYKLRMSAMRWPWQRFNARQV
ncbi:hypothetical protein BC826DRAFT_1011405 [Russula brevipes]|nr:hypothetical protein BC826DRAFT_1011405 [Russula brevipes]